MTPRNYQLLGEIAEEIIRTHGLNPGDLVDPEGFDEMGLQTLYERAIGPVWERVVEESPSMLGRLASCGSGLREVFDGEKWISVKDEAGGLSPSLYQVHCGSWIYKYWDGLTILRQVAVTAIVVEIWAQLRSAPEEMV
jgi:hypothetical protein